MSVELVTSRLNLVPCADEHIDGLNLLNSNSEVMRYLGGRPETRAETQAVIDRIKVRWKRDGYSWWSIFERLSGEIVGAGCIQNLRRRGTEPEADCPLEIGWRVRPDKWRQGIAMEAAIAMADFAFEQLRADVLYAVCDPENKASAAVMRKLGMRYRGLEDWYERKLTTYAITATSWRQSKLAPRPGGA